MNTQFDSQAPVTPTSVEITPKPPVSAFIKFTRMFLLLLIVIGILLLCTTYLWVPRVVAWIENQSLIVLPVMQQGKGFSTTQSSAVLNENFVGTTTFETTWEDNSGQIADVIDYTLILKSDGTGFLNADGYQTYWRLKVHAIAVDVPNASSSIDIFYDSTYADPQNPDTSSQSLFTNQDKLFGVDFTNGNYTFRKIDNAFEVSDGNEGTHLNLAPFAGGAVYCVNTHPGGRVLAAQQTTSGDLKFGLSIWSPEGNNIAEFGIASSSRAGSWIYEKNMTATTSSDRCQLFITTNKGQVNVTTDSNATCENDGGANMTIGSVNFASGSYESPVTDELNDAGTFFNHAGACLK